MNFFVPDNSTLAQGFFDIRFKKRIQVCQQLIQKIVK